MTGGILVMGLIVLASVAFIVAPLLRKDALEAERVAVALSEEMELQSEHDMVVASLRDLDEDRTAGKLDDDDYDQIREELTARAVKIMRRLDDLEAKHHARQARRTIPHPSAKSARS